MKIQFDPKQQYQLDAVNAVVDLFDGQTLEKPDFSVIFQTMDTELFAGQAHSELGVGNHLVIGKERLLQNLRAAQERNDLELSEDVLGCRGLRLGDRAAIRGETRQEGGHQTFRKTPRMVPDRNTDWKI